VVYFRDKRRAPVFSPPDGAGLPSPDDIRNPKPWFPAWEVKPVAIAAGVSHAALRIAGRRYVGASREGIGGKAVERMRRPMQARAGQRWASVLMFIALLATAPISCKETGDTRESSKSCRPAEDANPPPAGPYQYKAVTLAAFSKLLATPEWSAADPVRNAQGMLESIHEKTGLIFVLIPAGGFLMGSPEDEKGRGEDEGPVHAVRVSAFLMCRTECTQGVWLKGEWDIEITYSVFEDHPTDSVGWAESRDWCARNGLRLPSEAEWELACRAGTQTRFSFGDSDADLGRHAWYGKNADKNAEGWGHPVGKKLPNPWGLYDVHGNVDEWCEDFYGPYAEAPMDGSARTTPGMRPFRILRGGNRTEPAYSCRSAVRDRLDPDMGGQLNGFRPAADLPE